MDLRKISKVNHSAFLLIGFLLPFGIKAVSFSIVFWIVTYLTDAIVNRGTGDKLKADSRICILLVIFYLVQVLGLLYTSNIKIGYAKLESNISFILFGLTFFFGVNAHYQNHRQVLKVFILGNLLAVLLCQIRAFINSISWEGNSVNFNASISGKYSFFGSVIHGDNQFFSDNVSIFLQPSYFSMFLVFGIVSILLMWRKNSRFERIIDFIIAGLFMTFIYQLSSKAGILIAIIIITLFALFELRYSKFVKTFVVVAVFLSLGTSLMNPRFNDLRDTIQNKFDIKPNATESTEVRILAWKSAIEIIKENLLLGVDTGDAYDELKAVYKRNGYQYLYDRELNSHNQFLHVALTTGVVGTSIFLWLIFISFKRAYDLRNRPLLYFMIISSMNFLVENLFERLIGVVFFGYFLIYLSIASNIEAEPEN